MGILTAVSAAAGIEVSLDALSYSFNQFPLPTVLVAGPEHTVRYANPAFCALVGQTTEALTGRQIRQFLRDEEAGLDLLERVSANGVAETYISRAETGPDATAWSYTAWSAGASGLFLQVTARILLVEKTAAMNEALILGAIRQHELQQESDAANVLLQETQTALTEAHRLLGDKAVLLETLVQQRTVKLHEAVAEIEAFSYSIAHDLRAPLRSMATFSEILLQEHSSQLDPEGMNFLHRIVRSTGLMDQLVRDVLNYGQVLRVNLPLEIVDVELLVDELIENYPTFAPPSATITIQRHFPRVRGNAAMLMQILSHLLSNAVKFVRPGEKPQINLWAEAEDQRVKFFVQDHGIGIPADQQERVFGIFERLDHVNAGTGIGLAIVKKAAERIGGTVGVISELGHGTTFWFEVQRA